MNGDTIRYRIVLTVDYPAADSDGNAPDPADMERDIEQALPGRIYAFDAYPLMAIINGGQA
jgi:hypothetical protein